MTWAEEGAAQESKSPAELSQWILVNPPQTGTGERGDWAGLGLCSASCNYPHCSLPLLDVSLFPLCREEQEVVDSIQALDSPKEVTVASWTAAVPASKAGALLLGRWRAAGWVELLLPQGTAAQGSSVAGHVSPLSCSPFVSLCPGCQNLVHKTTFLQKVVDLCRSTTGSGSSERLVHFCRRYEVVERIQVRGHWVLWGTGQGPLALAPWEGWALVALGVGSCRVPAQLCCADAAGS